MYENDDRNGSGHWIGREVKITDLVRIRGIFICERRSVLVGKKTSPSRTSVILDRAAVDSEGRGFEQES